MNKLKHFHYLFCIFFPFIMGSKMFKLLGARDSDARKFIGALKCAPQEGAGTGPGDSGCGPRC